MIKVTGVNFTGGLIREGRTYYSTSAIKSIAPAKKNNDYNQTTVTFLDGSTIDSRITPRQWVDAFCLAERENGVIGMI